MPRMVLTLLGLVLAFGVGVAPATAGSDVPANVKLCKGFEFVYQGIPLTVYVRSDGSTFANYAECVRYAAQGGPWYEDRSSCASRSEVPISGKT